MTGAVRSTCDAFSGDDCRQEEWGIAALDAALEGIACRSVVHVCYGYGVPANLAWKASLGAEWDQYAHLLPLRQTSRVGGVSIERAPLSSRRTHRMLDQLRNGPDARDVAYAKLRALGAGAAAARGS
jgi:hypothetical protein